MNEAIHFIPVHLIASNPYQVRQAEDPAAVAELAANIEKNTLLQPPTVRPAKDAGIRKLGSDGCEYEIAFGHTRLAAFRLLKMTNQDYNLIPCFVKDLDDLQMFEMAVAEYIKRRDLNPIERARAMQTYMDTFKKTSAETGEFFNCDEATVRGTVRLLGLPDVAQAKLSSGELTIGAARSLLTLERIAPERVESAMKSIIDLHKLPEAAILSELSNEKNAQTLQHSYESRDPMAGDGLWKLDLEPKKFPAMPKLTIAVAQDAGAIDKDAGKHKKDIQSWIDQLEGGLVAPDALIASGVPAETVEKLAHLLNPPACAKCSYYITAGGNHVCGWKACWKRKVQAWVMAEAEKLSKKLEIPIYDPDRDGEYVSLDNAYHAEQKKAFTDRIPGLRLMVRKESKSYGSYDFTNSTWISLVDTTPEAVEAKKAADKRDEERRSHYEENGKKEQQEREVVFKNQRLSVQFIKTLAAPIFSVVLDPLKNRKVMATLFECSSSSYLDSDDHPEVLDDHGEVLAGKEQELDQIIRRSMVEDMLDRAVEDSYQFESKGPVAVAESLQPVAAEWGVTLPEDWLERAKAFEEQPEPNPEPEEASDEEKTENDEEDE